MFWSRFPVVQMVQEMHKIWDSLTTFVKTAEWYQKFYEEGLVITESQLESYIQDARQAGIFWVNYIKA